MRFLKNGSKLTLKNGYVLVGSGVTSVKISAQLVYINISASGDRHGLSILHNTTNEIFAIERPTRNLSVHRNCN